MTEITRVGDIKLEVMSTDVEGKQKCKRHNEQLTWEWKKNKNKKQIKDWKNIHAEPVTVEKIWKKKQKKKREKKNQKMWLEKEKRKEKKMKDNTNAFISMTFRTDACFLLYCFVKIVLLKILLISSKWGRAVH